MKHISWDYGSVDAAIEEIAKIQPPKRINVKTLCGKRVKPEYIDDISPDCPRCITIDSFTKKPSNK